MVSIGALIDAGTTTRRSTRESCITNCTVLPGVASCTRGSRRHRSITTVGRCSPSPVELNTLASPSTQTSAPATAVPLCTTAVSTKLSRQAGSIVRACTVVSATGVPANVTSTRIIAAGAVATSGATRAGFMRGRRSARAAADCTSGTARDSASTSPPLLPPLQATSNTASATSARERVTPAVPSCGRTAAICDSVHSRRGD